MAKRRVEWIGVISPLQDDRIVYRKMQRMYNDDEEVLLEAVADLVSPLIRQHASTARVKGRPDGYSKTYQWGPFHFVCEMEEIDADRLFANDPDEHEFRDLDNPAHDDRQPVVPWQYINKMLHRIMQEAANGPGIVKKGERVARTDREAERMLQQWATDRVDEAKDRGVVLDPRTLRIQRP